MQDSLGSAIGVRTVSPSEAELDSARFGLHRAHPHLSAKRVLHVTQAISLAALLALLVWAWRASPALTITGLRALAFTLFSILILWRLFAAARLRLITRTRFSPNAGDAWPTYTILIPLRGEASVVPDLAAALDRLDYPKAALDIQFLLEGDDVETINAVQKLSAAEHIEAVIIPPCAPRTKPKALNVGLARARGAYVVVYDAEDRPHPQQLRASLGAFQQGDDNLVCVQAPLAIDNGDASWIARQFAAEYAIQFREILPLIGRLGWPMPLGGTSNHFRVEALRAAGGWDPYNVTEDADLGFRLARMGKRCGMIAPPTYEEAPVGLRAWLGQRTRWIKGHLHTWLVLMRNPVRAAREMGLIPFLSMQLSLGGGLAASFAHGPLAAIVFMAAVTPFDLLTTADFALALTGYAVAVFGALTATALSGEYSHARAALTMPLYWPLASLAAYRAVFEIFARPHHWAKTAHGVSERAAPQPASARATALPEAAPA